MAKATENKYRSRFAAISWAKPATETNVVVVGTGGIGSWLSLFLARIGYNLTLIDSDTVDESNIGGQLFGTNQVGQHKVYAADHIIAQFTGVTQVYYNREKYKQQKLVGQHIIASCVDNMATRKQLLDDFESGKYPVELLVDGRLSAEQLQVYFVTKDRIAEYRKTIFDDKLVADAPCTNKATTHFGAGIAYVMTKGINNFLAIKAGEPRRLPFMVEEEGFVFTQNII